MDSRPWMPSPPALSADNLTETLGTHHLVAIHFWAHWNRALDEALDTLLMPLYKEFGDRIEFRSLDSDDRRLWPFLRAAEVLNFPAIGFWRNGQRDRVVIGVRSASAWRETIMEVLGSADS